MWWTAHGEIELPTGTDWLSAREQTVLAGMRYRKRHVEFLTRRWTAKRALAAVLQRDPDPASLVGLEIVHHPSGAPYVQVDGRDAAIDVSLTDRAGWAVCLVGAPGAITGPLGVDLELVEPRSDGFVEDFFTAAECRHVRGLPAGDARDAAANLIWSAKEAVLKVLKVGLRADTRDVEIDLAGVVRADGWAPFAAMGRDGAPFAGWWRRDGVFLLTIACTQRCEPPAALSCAADLARAEPLHSWLTQPLVG